MANQTIAFKGRESKTILAGLEDMVRRAEDARRPFEKNWLQNLAFFQGEHWWSWVNGRFAMPDMEDYRVLFTDNRIQPVILATVARLTGQDPTWEAVPANADEAAREDTLLASRLLSAKWADLSLSDVYEQAAMWLMICGPTFLKTTWNPSGHKGQEVAIDPATGEPLVDPQSGRLVGRDHPLAEMAGQSGMAFKWQNIGQGDVAVCARSPFDVLPDPLAGDAGISSLRWLVDQQIRSPEDLQERFDLPKPPEPDAEPVMGLVEARIPGVLGTGVEKEGVKTWELWERPSPKHRKGRYAVWCKGHLLAYEENPTKDGDLPYAMANAVWVPGRFWGMSPVDRMKDLNRELNKTRSQMRENAARIGNPPFMKPRDQQTAGWKGLPGEVVNADPMSGQVGGPFLPQFMDVPTLPGYIQNEPALIEAAIDRAAHQSDVSRGQVPAGVTAASAIQLLQEADQTIANLDARRLSRFLSRTGRQMLDLISDNYRTERVISIAGEDDEWDVVRFRSGQWHLDVPRVQVQSGSLIPVSKASRQAQMDYVLSLLVQHGYPLDPLNLAEYLKDYEVGALPKLMGNVTGDSGQISQENQVLLQEDADVPGVSEWDNHEAHMRGHERVMKSKRWRTLPEEVRLRFLNHWRSHREAAQQLQQQQMVMQMQAQAQVGAEQPQPGPQPGPPPPPGRQVARPEGAIG